MLRFVPATFYVALLLTLDGAPLAAGEPERNAKSPLNVLFIAVDDLRPRGSADRSS